MTYLFNDSRKQNVRRGPGEECLPSYRDNPCATDVLRSLVHIFSQTLTSETLFRTAPEVRPHSQGGCLEPAIASGLDISGGVHWQVRGIQNSTFRWRELTYVRGKNTSSSATSKRSGLIRSQLFSPGAGIFSPGCFFGGLRCAGAPQGDSLGHGLAFLFLEPRQFFWQQIPEELAFSTGCRRAFAAGIQDATSLKLRQLWSMLCPGHWKWPPTHRHPRLHYECGYISCRGGREKSRASFIRPTMAISSARELAYFLPQR